MNSRFSRMFDGIGGTGWWVIILFFIFIAFQDSWSDISISDWVPFLILLLILCSCGRGNQDDYDYMNNANCSCS
ncbi:MAG: hypothetical protein ACRC3Y_01345 [Romboutsia sp.]|uniref:hypothetical protein n=1 Tax=Romboutsia sp. TaxID=1965302 RepID=UPI003F38DF16